MRVHTTVRAFCVSAPPPLHKRPQTNVAARNMQPYGNTNLRATAHYHNCTAEKSDPCIYKRTACTTLNPQRQNIKVDLHQTHTHTLCTKAQHEALFKAIHTL